MGPRGVSERAQPSARARAERTPTTEADRVPANPYPLAHGAQATTYLSEGPENLSTWGFTTALG